MATPQEIRDKLLREAEQDAADASAISTARWAIDNCLMQVVIDYQDPDPVQMTASMDNLRAGLQYVFNALEVLEARLIRCEERRRLWAAEAEQRRLDRIPGRPRATSRDNAHRPSSRRLAEGEIEPQAAPRRRRISDV